MNRIRVIFFLIAILFLSCKEESVTPTSGYSVSGTVYSKGNLVEGASISIKNSSNLKTRTDVNGKFKLLNIPKGNHELTISKSSAEGGFSERTASITVEDDMTIDNLILPVGVILYEPTEITDRTLKLKWSQTDASDFREYKIYQHNTSGLDETTGTLIHVATSITDTTFEVPNLNALEKYFYRVYAMNEYGRLGGSNIVNTTTLNRQIIKNGSFEVLNSSTGYPENWDCDVFGSFWLVDSIIAQDGKYSLSVHDQSGVIMPWQAISPKELIAGSRYKLTYWVKHDEFKTSNYAEEFAIFMDNEEFTWHIQINTVSGPTPVSDWKEFTYEFTVPLAETSNFNILLYFLLAPDTYAWIDNISLIKVE